jgi:hypothetical protein
MIRDSWPYRKIRMDHLVNAIQKAGERLALDSNHVGAAALFALEKTLCDELNR